MAAFTVYDAAAGAGKTYTLVKNYLIKVLSSANKNRYKQILAVTFTNKAVAEMKGRILGSLYGFLQPNLPEAHEAMFMEVKEELGITSEALRLKSKQTLHYLLHNYTAFSVQTIDKFTQSVIRTFAHDLGLATNFEIELDAKRLLEHAVDELISQVGIDEQITKTVLDFTKNSVLDDKGWNIKKSLLSTASIIFQEDHIDHIEKLSRYKISDFEQLQKELKGKSDTNKKLIISLSAEMLSVFESEGIQNDFFKNYILTHFRLLEKTAEADFSAKWKQEIRTTSFYTKTKSDTIKQQIDVLRPKIEEVFLKTKNLIFQNLFIERVLKNVVQMSLLKSVNDKLQLLKKENKLVLISDFNRLIHDTIKDQPTPFIYERLGERYKDFFVDEFQDTSVMQWQNLLPLGDNAVSSLIDNSEETGTMTIVGDAKQAIYRWRGGKAEQFIELSNGKSPFSNPEKEVIPLNTNYRSHEKIIEFNNDFFSYLSNEFTSDTYKELYKLGNQQKTNHRKGGYVQFDFVEAANVENKNELYPEQVLQNIKQIISSGFLYSDICILVRKNREGVVIANYLNENQIPVLSSESLLVEQSNEVVLLMSLLEYRHNPTDLNKKLLFLKSVALYLKVVNVHSFLKRFIAYNIQEIEEGLHSLEVSIDMDCFANQSLFEAFESVIRAFGLHEEASANIQFFMDFVFEFTQNKNTGVSDFISHWELKKEKLSIVVPEGKNAVKIMSIHKAKGLEFPVVIFPYADFEIYKKPPENIWFPIEELSTTFKEAYVSYNVALFENYSEESANKVAEIKELQELDNFNVLYVALTRAKEQLFIVSNSYETKKGLPNHSFQSYFVGYLSQNNNFLVSDRKYCLGDSNKVSTIKKEDREAQYLKKYWSSVKEHHGIHVVLSDNTTSLEQQEAIDLGEFAHELMAEIFDKKDVPKVLLKYKLQNRISKTQFNLIENNILDLIKDQRLINLFSEENIIYNERDFIHKGELLRPDRVEIVSDEIVIMDYKTGTEDAKYIKQIQKYGRIFEDLKLKKLKKFIIYMGESIKIVEV